MKESKQPQEELRIESVAPICLTEAEATLRIDRFMEDILKILDSDLG